MKSFDSGDPLNVEASADRTCPKCHFPGMKEWNELTDEQQFLLKRLPLSAEYTPKERKKHRFCERCWFEIPESVRLA